LDRIRPRAPARRAVALPQEDPTPTPKLRWSAWAAFAFLAAAAAVSEASNVVHMTLRDLVGRADRIVRGTVIDADEGVVGAGGGTLPIVVYRIQVEEVLKGSVADGEVLEVRMLGTPKQLANGPYRRASLLRDLPRFAVGRDYLFALTRPSRIGLSTTVGLGQGLFQLRGRRGQETAVNDANNLGLFESAGRRQAPGPVPYATLVKEIRSALGQ
jgi:hypothetical protein